MISRIKKREINSSKAQQILQGRAATTITITLHQLLRWLITSYDIYANFIFHFICIK